MARGKAISVKIATPKVIKALEASLEKLNKDYASQEANEKKHQKAVEKYQKELGKLAVAHISKADEVQASENWRGELNVRFTLPAGTFTIPAEPVKDFTSIHEYNYREQKEEMENAIRILKMTDEEVVSTSTYQAVARYL